MNLHRRFWCLSGLILLLSGCSTAPTQERTALEKLLTSVPPLGWLQPVKTIAQVTQRDDCGTTQLGGMVTAHVPLVEQWLYQLNDSSGQLWVLTPEAPPAIGSQATIRAQVCYERILMGGSDIGEHYAEEIERLSVESLSPTSTPQSDGPEIE